MTLLPRGNVLLSSPISDAWYILGLAMIDVNAHQLRL